MTNLVQPDVPAVMGGGRPTSPAGVDGRLPLPWVLFLLVFAAWYPLDPWWLSDDFVAVQHASDLGRAVSDFAGNQYGVEGVVWFYRPLITLSFWVEQTLFGGPSAYGSHVVNALAHATSACLVGVLGVRFLGPLRGWLAGLVWALAPTHAGAVFWAVGRVDSHTMVWMLLACVMFVRFVDGRTRTRWPAMLALALGLCSKEQAVVVPAAAALCGFCAGAPRLRRALASWPLFVVLGIYLGVRYEVLGRIGGGYDASSFDVLASARGLVDSGLTLLDPMRALGGHVFPLPDWTSWLGYAPALVALGCVVTSGRLRLLAACAIAFVVAALPTAQFWAQSQDAQSLRYFYVPFVALAFVLAAGGVVPVVLALAVFALPTVEQHRDWFAAFRETGAMHRQLIADERDIPEGPMFVAGLPRQNARGTVVQFHLGVDRLLRPPFVAGPGRQVLALRPLAQRDDAIRIPYGDDRGLPFDAPVLRFDGAASHTLLPRADVPDCTVRLDGMDAIATADLLALDEGRAHARIVVRGVRAATFRVTLFTAGGYLSAIVPDRGDANGTDGVVDVVDLLRARYVTTVAGDGAHVAFALAIPTTFDLEPAFPVLVEALRDGATTHANRDPLLLRFDRRLAEFMIGR